MTSDEYAERLKRVDWLAEYSEDQRVWRKHVQEVNALSQAQRLHDPEYALWNAIVPVGKRATKLGAKTNEKKE